MSSEKYVKSAIQNIEETLQKMGQWLPSKCKKPLAYGYRPELDVNPELKADGLQRYQELIGILCWAVKLGRVDILMETSMMSTHLAMLRWGHLEQVHHIYGYLKEQPKRKLFLTCSTWNWTRGHSLPTIGMTSTETQKSQFRGTCLHLEVKWLQHTVL